MSTAALFITARKWIIGKRPWTNEQTHKKGYIHTMRENKDTSAALDDLWEHHAKGKKQVIKVHVLHDSLYMTTPEQANL